MKMMEAAMIYEPTVGPDLHRVRFTRDRYPIESTRSIADTLINLSYGCRLSMPSRYLPVILRLQETI